MNETSEEEKKSLKNQFHGYLLEKEKRQRRGSYIKFLDSFSIGDYYLTRDNLKLVAGSSVAVSSDFESERAL